jgi:hypothetical protein
MQANFKKLSRLVWKAAILSIVVLPIGSIQNAYAAQVPITIPVLKTDAILPKQDIKIADGELEDFFREQAQNFGINAACEAVSTNLPEGGRWKVFKFLGCEAVSTLFADKTKQDFWLGRLQEIGIDGVCDAVFGDAGLVGFFACESVSQIKPAWDASEKVRVQFAAGQLPNSSGEEKHSGNWWNVVNTAQSTCSSYLQTMGQNIPSAQTYISIDQFNDTNSGSFNCSWGEGTSIDVPKTLSCSILNNNDPSTGYYTPGTNEYYAEAGCYRDERHRYAY